MGATGNTSLPPASGLPWIGRVKAKRWVVTAVGLSAAAGAALVALPGLAAPIVSLWLLGLIAVVAAALSSLDGAQVRVYGPHGQSALVTEREALRRVAGQGWSYEPTDEHGLRSNDPRG